MILTKLPLTVLCILCFAFLKAQNTAYWHDSIRQVHYLPKGDSFELKHGRHKFNRALYGTNTGFRVETGDVPEFAMYMPGMGGNFKLGIAKGGSSKWITEVETVKTVYSPGVMAYTLTDEIIEGGEIRIEVVALAKSEGFLLKLESKNIPEQVEFFWVFGGASGKKFHRDGDIGADPESVFYLHPEYCLDNQYQTKDHSFKLSYGAQNNKKKTGNNKSISGNFPSSTFKIASASNQNNPLEVFQSQKDDYPVIVGKLKFINEQQFWKFENTEHFESVTQEALKEEFIIALQETKKKASIVEVETPDPYINTLGGALATAADAMWESPAFLHGSVAWRMHLNAWRGAYVADPLGWHDRAESHFTSYANSQVINPPSGPVVPDTLRNFARQKEEIGTAMFSRGYISRRPNNNTIAHHYDMNSVFFNQVLRHYLWTGNEEFIQKMWPAIQRHLAWEKRNFDADGNHLYDAYACIWASDALQYTGGSVSYSSAYNFSANKIAYEIGEKLQKPLPGIENYNKESNQIKKALNEELWIKSKGIFAEYKDFLGNQLTHNHPGIWSIYHPIDEGVADPFQAYQMLRYIDTEIPHIPVKAVGLPHTDLSLISTTDWQPYTWSVNNVAMAEVLHTSLAYWQGQRPEKAFKLWQSAIIESMYLGTSPGNFQQLSFYDSMRGELYRDFADPIGMAARSLTEGLFGINPNALTDTLSIRPGFPETWNHARIKLPDINYAYRYFEGTSHFKITPNFPNKMGLELILTAKKQTVEYIKINGRILTDWKVDTKAVVRPKLIINAPYQKQYEIEVKWNGPDIEKLNLDPYVTPNSALPLSSENLVFMNTYDPQSLLESSNIKDHSFSGQLANRLGDKSFFIKVKQGDFIWWQPINLEFKPQLELDQVTSTDNGTWLKFNKNGSNDTALQLRLNHTKNITLEKGVDSLNFTSEKLVPGTNRIDVIDQKESVQHSFNFQNWDLNTTKNTEYTSVDLSGSFNSMLRNIFKQSYLSPRPKSPTLQLPTQGIGNWCYPTIAPEIDDSGLKALAAENKDKIYYQNIPFAIGPTTTDDIVFTSKWDNFPDKVEIDLTGKARHVYLLMTGTTNPMQSQFQNGLITVHYKDGTQTELILRNPDNWWPIEQDYYTDNFAFKIDADSPPRLHLKTGKIYRNFTNYSSIKGFTDYAIDGGAASILDLSLDPDKELDYLELKTIANEVVIGIMSITLLK